MSGVNVAIFFFFKLPCMLDVAIGEDESLDNTNERDIRRNEHLALSLEYQLHD